jgi:hypothetical protein
VSQRGQITIAAVGGLTAVLLGTVVLLHLSRIAAGGATAQTAADMAALAAARTLAGDPVSPPSAVRAAAASAARANGARLVDLEVERVGAVATAVDVTAFSAVDGSVPVAGPQHDGVLERARAGVTYTASLPAGAFRPVDLHGAHGPLAAVAAAEAQVGWPYVWGGESRAEGGFDYSLLIGTSGAVLVPSALAVRRQRFAEAVEQRAALTSLAGQSRPCDQFAVLLDRRGDHVRGQLASLDSLIHFRLCIGRHGFDFTPGG